MRVCFLRILICVVRTSITVYIVVLLRCSNHISIEIELVGCCYFYQIEITNNQWLLSFYQHFGVYIRRTELASTYIVVAFFAIDNHL